MATVKRVQVPIAWWDPTRKRGGRLVLYRNEWTKNGVTEIRYAYQGDGASGDVAAHDDAEAIASVEREVVLPSHKLVRTFPKVRRAGVRRAPQRDRTRRDLNANNTASRTPFTIYVIELGPSALLDPLFEHEFRDDAKPCLYVGSTAKDVRVRHEEHCCEDRMSTGHAVRKHGSRGLRFDLARGKYATSRQKAEEIERRVAESLRRQGFGVAQH